MLKINSKARAKPANTRIRSSLSPSHSSLSPVQLELYKSHVFQCSKFLTICKTPEEEIEDQKEDQKKERENEEIRQEIQEELNQRRRSRLRSKGTLVHTMTLKNRKCRYQRKETENRNGVMIFKSIFTMKKRKTIVDCNSRDIDIVDD